MIVQPNFLDHWKTNALGAAIGRLEAITALLSLWAHCQNQRTWRFPNNDLMIAGICRFTGNPRVLVDTLLQLNLLEKADENTLAVHEWAETNAKLLHNWDAGKKGGRPSKQPKGKPTENPRVNPWQTQGEPKGEPIREDKIREENTPIVPKGTNETEQLPLSVADSEDSTPQGDTPPPAKKKKGGGAAAREIYEFYPRKVGKDAALRAIQKRLDQGLEPIVLMTATRLYAEATAKWPAEDRQFIPHPATWFNRGSYDDDPREWQRAAPEKKEGGRAPWTNPDEQREEAVSASLMGVGGPGVGPEGWEAAMDELEGPDWRICGSSWRDLSADQRRRVTLHLINHNTDESES
jgi:hypothetical protein